MVAECSRSIALPAEAKKVVVLCLALPQATLRSLAIIKVKPIRAIGYNIRYSITENQLLPPIILKTMQLLPPNNLKSVSLHLNGKGMYNDIKL